MKEVLELLKTAGFSPATLAQAAVAAAALTALALVGTGLATGSAAAMFVGFFVIALAALAIVKAALAWRRRGADEGEGGAS